MVGCEGEDQEIIYLFTGRQKLPCQNNRLDVTQLSPELGVTQKPLNYSRTPDRARASPTLISPAAAVEQ